MRNFSILGLLGCFVPVSAAQVAWDLYGSYPGSAGDTVLVRGDSIEIRSEIHLPAGAVLALHAQNGIRFMSGAALVSSAPHVQVLAFADADADGRGSFACVQAPCIKLEGDSSLVKVVESVPGIPAGMESLSGTAWAGAQVGLVGSRSEHLLQANSWSDLVAFAAAARRLSPPRGGWGLALGKSMRAGSAWLPMMGPGNAPLQGVIDGQGHVISGLRISEPALTQVGFVGRGRNLTIRGLGFDSASVLGSSHAGVIAGSLENSDLQSCYVRGIVRGDAAVGGLVGLMFESGVRNSYAQVRASGLRHVGGIAGLLSGRSNVSRVWFEGSADAQEHSGPIFGSAWQDSHVLNSYWAEGSSARGGDCLQSQCRAVSVNDAAMRRASTFDGFDFGSIWSIREGEDYPRLSGFGSAQGAAGRADDAGSASETSLSGLLFNIQGSQVLSCPPNVPCVSEREVRP